MENMAHFPSPSQLWAHVSRCSISLSTLLRRPYWLFKIHWKIMPVRESGTTMDTNTQVRKIPDPLTPLSKSMAIIREIIMMDGKNSSENTTVFLRESIKYASENIFAKLERPANTGFLSKAKL